MFDYRVKFYLSPHFLPISLYVAWLNEHLGNFLKEFTLLFFYKLQVLRFQIFDNKNYIHYLCTTICNLQQNYLYTFTIYNDYYNQITSNMLDFHNLFISKCKFMSYFICILISPPSNSGTRKLQFQALLLWIHFFFKFHIYVMLYCAWCLSLAEWTCCSKWQNSFINYS